MKKRMFYATAVLLAFVVGGCEACNGGIGGESKVIAKPIIEHAYEVCGKVRDQPPHGGIVNIMLMTDREDDGIVTCGDGHTEYFDE